MKVIHTDNNGVQTLALAEEDGGTTGHNYEIGTGNINTFFVKLQEIKFQNGPVKEHGVNGVTNESLIAILIDRIGILNTKFPCNENQLALDHLEMALGLLEQRTKGRVDRGVEGMLVA